MKRKSTFILMALFMGLMCAGAYAQVNTNVGFEDWSGTTPSGWGGSTTNGTFAKYTDGAYEGENALQLINTSNSHKRFSTAAVAVEDGKRYAVSFYAKGNGEVRVGLYDGTSGVTAYKYNNYFNINSNTYSLFTDTLDCTTTTSSAQFLLSFRNTDPDMDHLVLDNVVFSIVGVEDYVAVPVIALSGSDKYDDTTYINSATVSMTADEGAEIHYTIDGTDPDENSTLYSSPFEITENTDIKAIAILGDNVSGVVRKNVQIITANLLFFKNFEETSLGEMTSFTNNDEVNWLTQSHSGNNYAYVNGYNKGEATSWLITPEITPENPAGVILSFVSAKNYTGAPISVKYSTDYSGSGEPAAATWTDITDEFSYSSGNWNWKYSGDYELAGAAPVRFAWIYTCTDSAAAAWEIDNIMVVPSNNIVAPELSITAPADGSEFLSTDILPVEIEINNFEPGTDGYLKLESDFVENLMGVNPVYLDAEMLSYLQNDLIITPMPGGTYTINASLVDMDSVELDPAVAQSVTFTVTKYEIPSPIITPDGGTFADSVNVAFDYDEEFASFATIYYTIDGSEPTEESELYLIPITLHESATVKAKAFISEFLADYYAPSATVSAGFVVVSEPVLTATPSELTFSSSDLSKTFTVSGAHLTEPITLSTANSHFTLSAEEIAEPNSNTQITVTFDGAEPASDVVTIVSGEFSAEVALSATAKLPAPEFNPAAATSEESIVVEITSTVAGAAIHYTLNGDEPTAESEVYSEPLSFTEVGTYTVKAIAMKENWENSDIATGTYTISSPTINDTVIYATGFEASEGFEASTVYNNSEIKYTGNDGEQWGTYYGTPSTTNMIDGGQSMQMRWYSSASGNLGYTFTNFDLRNVTHVIFKAANSNGLKVNVSHSVDGGTTYSEGQTFDVASSAREFDYVVSETGEYDYVRLKFAIVMPATTPNANSRLVIDNVAVYGIIGLAPTTVAAPQISPASNFYYEPQSVEITSVTEDAVIRYTTDGTQPDENSTLYTAPFTVSATTTVNAKAWKDGMTPSFVSSATISFPVQAENIAAFKANTSDDVQQILSDVTFVFRSGRYIFVEDNSAALLIYDNQNPVITTEYNEGDVIQAGVFGKYKLYNGLVELEPTHNSPASTTSVSVEPTAAGISDIKDQYSSVYESRLVSISNVMFINGDTFVQNGDTMRIFDRFDTLDIEIAEGMMADVTGFVSYSDNFGYQIYPRGNEDITVKELEKVANPEFSFQLSGEFYFMDITCATEGADIYYTIDGTDPDESSYHFTSQIPLQPEPLTIKAIAMKEGMQNSDIVTYNFVGVNDYETTFSVYPNPATDILVIEGRMIDGFEIFNMAGQKVKSGNIGNTHAKINVRDIADGTYIVRIKGLAGSYSTTFIKK